MKFRLINIHLKTSIFLLFTAIIWSSMLFNNINGQNDARSEVIVMFKPGAVTLPKGKKDAKINELQISNAQIKTALSQNNVKFISKAFPKFTLSDTLGITRTGERVRLADLSNIFILEVSDTTIVRSLINALSNLKDVVYAEPNFHAYRGLGFPDDPHYQNGDQWGLNNYGQNGGTNDADIDAPEAWQITTGSNVKIGIIDDGVDAGHEDLSGKVSGDAGVYGGNQSWHFGHGTHVAGIAAAIGNNNKGIAGVNWAGKINSQRIENGSDVDFYNGIMAAVNAGALVLNNSWGGYNYSTTIRMAFANAYKLNVVSVASMGNDNTSNISYPAGYGQGIIAVGATDKNDHRSIWTNGGSNYGNHIDVTAPGTSIWSSIPYINKYASWSGTSMAAPFVSGIASLLKGYNSSLSNDDIENIIKISADDVNSNSYPGWDQYLGYGRVNARKALDLLRSPYVLSHKSADGGSVYSNSGGYYLNFYGASGLQDGTYWVKRYDVRKSVSFNYTTETHVWGRGVGTNGYSDESLRNYGMGYCDVVSNNNSSATLRTYVYEVWSINELGQITGYKGFYPTTPSNVHFEYTVLGENAPLSVYISGPHFLDVHENGTWTANASGGTPGYHYQWWYEYPDNRISLPGGSKKPGHGYWLKTGSDSKYLTRQDDEDFDLKVDVTDAHNTKVTSSVFNVIVGGDNAAQGNMSVNSTQTYVLPTETKLLSNYPNPFNPSTTIKYQLKEPGFVTLKVYDILGKEVAALVNENKGAGYYSVHFDASKLSSGLYIYRLRVNNFVESKKMLLTK